MQNLTSRFMRTAPLVGLLTVAALFGWTDSARAQQTTARRLTLREAVGLAAANHRAVQLAEVGVERAAAEHQQARSIFRPQVLLGSGLAYSKGFPLSIEGSAPSIFQVNASQALFDQSLRNIERQAKAMRESVEKTLEDQRDAAIVETALAYLDLDRSRRSLTHLQEQARALEATAELIRERVGTGLDAPVEESKAKLAAARARSAARSAQSSIDLLSYRLRDLTGIAQSEAIETVQPELNLVEDVSAVAALAERALANHPALAGLDAEVRSREFAVRSEQATRFPRVHLVGQYALFSKHNNYEDYFQRFERNNVTIGASIVVPLYERERYSARLSKAEADLKEARARRDNAKAQISQQVRELAALISQQQDSREVVRLELEVARKSLDAVLAQYEEGRVNRMAIEAARVEENRAWVNLFDTEYQAERAKLELLRLTGELRAALL